MSASQSDELAWARFDLDTPQDVIDDFIEQNVMECVEDAREQLAAIPMTEAQRDRALERVEHRARQAAREAFAKGFKALMH